MSDAALEQLQAAVTVLTTAINGVLNNMRQAEAELAALRQMAAQMERSNKELADEVSVLRKQQTQASVDSANSTE